MSASDHDSEYEDEISDQEEEDNNNQEEEEEELSGPIYKIAIFGGKSVKGDKLLYHCQNCMMEKCSLETWTVDQEPRFHEPSIMKFLSSKSRAIFFVFSLIAPSTIKNVISWFEGVNANHTHYYPILVGTGYREAMATASSSQATTAPITTIDTMVHELAQKMRAAIVYVKDEGSEQSSENEEKSYLPAIQLAVQLMRGEGVSLEVNTDITKGPILEYEHALSRTEENATFSY